MRNWIPAFAGMTLAFAAAAYAAGPVGLVVAGPLIDTFGVEATSLGVAAVVLATSLVCFVLPLRGFDDLTEPPRVEPHVGSVPRADAPQIGGGVPGDQDERRGP